MSRQYGLSSAASLKAADFIAVFHAPRRPASPLRRFMTFTLRADLLSSLPESYFIRSHALLTKLPAISLLESTMLPANALLQAITVTTSFALCRFIFFILTSAALYDTAPPIKHVD